ncbi:MAG: PTS sugar transporter subunit IIA [Mycoplasmataceae bacterium]|nr:PTS sugar transporter subunit IIA [Mycoplasmataceae bacterium]
MKLITKKLITNSKSETIFKTFDEIAELLINDNIITNKKELIDGFKKREKQSSTALVDGFAIPHTVNSEIKEPKIIILQKSDIKNWKTIDGSKVDTVIAIIVPKNGRNNHLLILSKLSAKLVDPKFSKMIKTSSSSKVEKEINSLIIEKKEEANKSSKKSFDIVAVTSCPTGIAHTYMAAEFLEKKASEMGLTIKIETQGQTVQSVLTDKEIKEAKAIIIAADREVEMERFAGEKIYKTSTKKVISDAELHINNALKGKDTQIISTSVRTTNGEERIAGQGQLSLENFGSRAWKSVMNGVSFMLPFVIFGGIFIALAFLFDIGNSNAVDGSFGTGNPVSLFIKSIGGISMGLMIPMLTAYTMYSLIGRPGLLPGFVIGMLAAGSGPIFTETFGLYTENGIPNWVPEEFIGTSAVSSGFIGGIVGAFLGTVIVVLISQVLDFLPKSMRGIKQILLLPLFGTAFASIIFWFINIPLIYVTWGLLTLLMLIHNAGLTWMLALLLAGMMAVDMGGPVNKTAYVFGTVMVSLSTTGFEAGGIYMAAVMAGGMVPPLSIAIATCFKRKTLWDDDDKEGGITNWIMGASFITEGAIPFASKYPKVIMPAIIAGSTVSGLIVGLLQITIAAPHGGIFVFALVNSLLIGPIWLSIILYIMAILIGAAVAAAIILVLKTLEIKKVNAI